MRMRNGNVAAALWKMLFAATYEAEVFFGCSERGASSREERIGTPDNQVGFF